MKQLFGWILILIGVSMVAGCRQDRGQGTGSRGVEESRSPEVQKSRSQAVSHQPSAVGRQGAGSPEVEKSSRPPSAINPTSNIQHPISIETPHPATARLHPNPRGMIPPPTRGEGIEPKGFPTTRNLSKVPAGPPYWLGNPSVAKVKIVSFDDLLCPHCAHAHEVLLDVLKAYSSDQVAYTLKFFPLWGEDSRLAMKAALAAGRQGRFFEAVQWIFTHQLEAYQEGIWPKWMGPLKLNPARFQKDLKDPALDAFITRQEKEGRQQGVQGTPALFINGERFNGGRTVEHFKAVIQAYLSLPPSKEKK